MSMTIRVVIDILLGLGVFFGLVGVLGIIRMPDTYGRLQASTCIPSLGNIFMIAGGVVYAIATNVTLPGTYVKLIVLMLMILLTNPIAGHAMCKAAVKMGVLPANVNVVDDYKEDELA